MLFNNFILNLSINPFSIFLLILNCIFILIFKKWLGPNGLFYISVTCLVIFFINNFTLLYYNIMSGSYIFLDFGIWFLVLDILDSRALFCFDNLTVILSIVVSLLTIFAKFFGIEYMSREAFISRLVLLLNLFATSVLFLFCVYDFLLILIAWELIGLFSFLLVNFYSLTIFTIKSSLKTFIFSRLSDIFIFFSFNISILIFNTSDLSIIFIKTPFYLFHNMFIWNVSINSLNILTLSISLASVIKAAQFGFHVWLPDAMNAPTPASSLIHSSTLVIMGIYLIIRFNMVFEFTPNINILLASIGSLTIALGAVVAVFQTDIKKLVAYSTISQMGYLVSGCGFCAYEETVIYLIMHALNKAFLFIIVGYTVHFFNSNTDLRQMGGMYIYSFDLAVYYVTISINLMGLPFSSGFYSKEFLLFQLFNDDLISNAIKTLWFVSFIFTPIYMFILVHSVNYKNKFGVYLNYKNLNNNLFINNSFGNYLNKFEVSYITSKFTIFLLFSFWFLLNNYGDYFFLLLNNINNSQDSMSSNSILNSNFKYFLSINLPDTLYIGRFLVSILLLTLVSLKFLLLNFSKNIKNYYKLNTFIELIYTTTLIIIII